MLKCWSSLKKKLLQKTAIQDVTNNKHPIVILGENHTAALWDYMDSTLSKTYNGLGIIVASRPNLLFKYNVSDLGFQSMPKDLKKLPYLFLVQF